MPDWKAHVTSRFGAGGPDDDVLEEIAQHAAELYRTARADGRSDAESRALVEAELANLPVVLQAARERRPRRPPPVPEPASGRLPALLGAFARDIAFAARLMAARPAFSAIAVATLALGIGANTAMFSVVHSVLIEPLPFPEPDRLVMLWEADADDPDDVSIVSAPNYQDWARLASSFAATAIWEYQSFNISGGDDPEQVPGMRVSSSLFPMLGVAPQIGRTFSAEEDGRGHNVVVISDALWRRRFGGDPSIVGRSMRLNGEPFDIVGVMPPSFRFTLERHGVWVPIRFTAQDAARDSHSFYAAARLKDGVAFDAAKAEMDAIGRQLAAEYRSNTGETATITRMNDLGVGQLRDTLLMLQSAVVLVLLIACVNVANLLLGQAAIRQREFAIRAALGAGRARIASHLFAEGMLLALAGGAAGVLLAWIGTAVLADSLPAAIRFAPFRDTGGMPLDTAVLAFTFALAMLTGVLFSMAPIAGAWRTAPDAALRTGGDRTGTARLRGLRRLLVAAQVALAVIVLSATGLLVKSMIRLIAVDPGLAPEQVLTMNVALPQEDFYGAPERPTFCSDVSREVGSLPGVLAVGAISHLPLSGANAGRGFAIEGRPEPPPGEGAGAFYRVTCPGYFRTLGIPVIAGRDFTPEDSVNAPMAVLVNERTAETYWPGESPLGKRIKFGSLRSDTSWLTIVGIVGDVRHFGLDEDAFPEIYRPYSQVAWPVMTATVKTATEPLAMASAVRSALRRIDPDQAVSSIRSMDQVLDQSLGFRRFPMLLLTFFSGVAFLLAAIGVYGVVSYLASQRTREIGIRVALGARPGAVERLIVRHAAVPIAAGLLAGVGGAMATSRLLEALLYEVRPSDPFVLVTIAAALGFAALMASWIPARRAAGADPLVVLRQE